VLAGALLLDQCSFLQNSASVSGGGIALQDLPLSLQLVRVTRMTAASNNAGLFGGGNPLLLKLTEVPLLL